MKNSKILALIYLLLLLPGFILPVSANSAQQYWSGTDASGAIVTDGDSPIVVESELLTFDLTEFPSNYYFEEKDFLTYTGKVTAEYTFYNPSDMTVTSTLAFPFGRLPDYAEGDNASKYGITVNGNEIEVTVRHTMSDRYADFELNKDLPLISDEYIKTDFYKPDTTVTLYGWTVSGIDTEERTANIAFDVKAGDTDRQYYLVGQSGAKTQNDGDYRISDWVKNNDSVMIYVFGDPLAELPQLKFYKDGGVEDGEEIDGTLTYKGSETMTLEKFALANRDLESSVSEVDWYNAVIAELSEGGKNGKYPVVSLSKYESGFSRYFMRWYQYDITLAPGERIVNAVTAPMYPSIDMSYVPTVFEYTYLTSTASTWADFGHLTILINTPYYITESSVGEFKKTENGYKLTLDGLPMENGEYKELIFSLSTEENPMPRSKTPDGIKQNITYFLAYYALPIFIGVAALILIFFIIKKYLKDKTIIKRNNT